MKTENALHKILLKVQPILKEKGGGVVILKKIAKKFLIFNELWQIFLVIRYLRLEKSVAWQSVVQQSIQKDAPTNAPKIAQWLCEKYPKVFEYSACGICDSMNSKPAHLGAVFLENKLTPYSPGVPFYARFCFPLIYSECQECGAARINPRPVRSWIDHVEPDLPPPAPPTSLRLKHHPKQVKWKKPLTLRTNNDQSVSIMKKWIWLNFNQSMLVCWISVVAVESGWRR